MILDRLLSHDTKLAAISTAKDPADWLIDAFGGSTSASGIRVTPRSALSLAAYYAALRCISEDVAKVPLLLYRRLKPRGKARETDDPRFKLLHDQPNALMTSMTFRETLTSHALGWGNGYAEIIFDGGGQVEALELLLPDRVSPEWDNRLGRVRYRISAPNGMQRMLPDFKVLHLHGLGFDGITGYSIAALAKDTIGLGLAQERSGSKLFENAVMSGGVLEHPGVLDEDARRNLRESWERTYGGVDNTGKTKILEEGMKFHSTVMPMKDAQFIEGRGFSVQDIARFFRIPCHKLCELSGATFSNIEQQSLEYVTDTLIPWFVRWEQEISRKILNGHRDDDLFAEHLVDGLLRGDISSRFGAYSTARQWGWMSANDILELENRNPIGEQGDIYISPMNMIPADQLGQVPEPEASAEPAEQTETTPSAGMKIIISDKLRDADREQLDIGERALEVYLPLFMQAFADKQKIAEDRIASFVNKRDCDALTDRFYDEHAEHVSMAIEPLCVALLRSVAPFVAVDVVIPDSGQPPLSDRIVCDYIDLLRQGTPTDPAQEAAIAIKHILQEIKAEG